MNVSGGAQRRHLKTAALAFCIKALQSPWTGPPSPFTKGRVTRSRERMGAH
jgi:hypothetical protein